MEVITTGGDTTELEEGEIEDDILGSVGGADTSGGRGAGAGGGHCRGRRARFRQRRPSKSSLPGGLSLGLEINQTNTIFPDCIAISSSESESSFPSRCRTRSNSGSLGSERVSAPPHVPHPTPPTLPQSREPKNNKNRLKNADRKAVRTRRDDKKAARPASVMASASSSGRFKGRLGAERNSSYCRGRPAVKLRNNNNSTTAGNCDKTKEFVNTKLANYTNSCGKMYAFTRGAFRSHGYLNGGRQYIPSQEVRTKARMSPSLDVPHSLSGLSADGQVENMTYDELLLRYQLIQSKLSHLNQEEVLESRRSSNRTGDKENLKRPRDDHSDRRSPKVWRSDRGKDYKLPVVARRRRSRGNSESKLVTQEDDDEQELRRIALASTKQKPTDSRSNTEPLNKDVANIIIPDPKDIPLPLSTDPVSSPDHDDNMQDNYEEVSMDLDSNSEGVEEGEDEDADLLRAKLLISLAAKKREVGTPPLPPIQPFLPPPQIIGERRNVHGSVSQHQAQQLASSMMPPVHSPVIIRLGEDSSDSEPDDTYLPISNGVDQLLREARLNSDIMKKKASAVSAGAVRSVELVTPPNRIVPGKQHVATQQTQSQRKAHQIARFKELEAQIEQQKQAMNSSDNLKLAALNDRLRQHEQDLEKNRESVIFEERQLNFLRKAVLKKRQNLSDSEKKVKLLREQLLAAERIASVNRAGVASMSAKIVTVEASFNRRVRETVTLQKACDDVTQLMNKKDDWNPAGLPVNLNNSVEHKALGVRTVPLNYQRLRRKSIVRNRPAAAEISLTETQRPKFGKVASLDQAVLMARTPENRALEKARLQKLEKMIGLKLQELRNRNMPPGSAVSMTTSVASPSQVVELSEILPVPQIQLDKKPVMDVQEQDNLVPYSLDSVFFPPIAEMKERVVFEHNSVSPGTSSSNLSVNLHPYRTPLLHVRSYRISPYFRVRDGQSLSSTTHAHKMDPKQILCHFELAGSCNDEQCPWQHSRDYVLSVEEMVADLVAYCPPLVGLEDEPSIQQLQLAATDYAKKLVQIGTQDKMSTDQLCLLALSKVSDQLKADAPHFSILEERAWRPGLQRELGPRLEERIAQASSDSSYLEDASADAAELRYFNAHYGTLASLESAVQEDRSNPQLWINLADYHLNEKRSSEQESVNLALTILSRGLDANQNSHELWQHYLGLYRRLPDSDKEMPDMYRRAVEFAPCYELWWKCLAYTENCDNRWTLFSDMLTHLRSPTSSSSEELSRRVLEVLLCRSHMGITSGRLDLACKSLEEALQLNEDLLIPDDRCLAWLCLIYLQEFSCLPSHLLQQSDRWPCRLVSQKPFLLPWRPNVPPKQSEAVLFSQFRKALKHCTQRGQTKHVNTVTMMPLYRSLLSLELAYNRPKSVIGICRKLVQAALQEEEVWLLFASTHSLMGNPDLVQLVLQESLGNLPKSFHLIFVHALSLLQMSGPAAAEEALRNGIANLCPEDEIVDAAVLYRQMMGISLPEDELVQVLGNSVAYSQEKQNVYLGMSYSLLLELTNRHDMAVEVLNVIRGRVLNPQLLQTTWIFEFTMELQRMSRSSDLQQAFSTWIGRIRRCFFSMPDVGDFHSRLALLLVDSLLPEQRPMAWELLCQWMPTNPFVLKRLLMCKIEAGQFRAGIQLVCDAIARKEPSAEACKLAFSVASQSLSRTEVRSLGQHFLKALPYNAQLWTEVMSWERNFGRDADVLAQMQQRILDLGLVIDDPKTTSAPRICSQ